MSDQPKGETWNDNTEHSQEASMTAAGFEPAIPVSECSQNNGKDRAVTGISGI